MGSCVNVNATCAYLHFLTVTFVEWKKEEYVFPTRWLKLFAVQFNDRRCIRNLACIGKICRYIYIFLDCIIQFALTSLFDCRFNATIYFKFVCAHLC